MTTLETEADIGSGKDEGSRKDEGSGKDFGSKTSVVSGGKKTSVGNSHLVKIPDLQWAWARRQPGGANKAIREALEQARTKKAELVLVTEAGTVRVSEVTSIGIEGRGVESRGIRIFYEGKHELDYYPGGRVIVYKEDDLPSEKLQQGEVVRNAPWTETNSEETNAEETDAKVTDAKGTDAG